MEPNYSSLVSSELFDWRPAASYVLSAAVGAFFEEYSKQLNAAQAEAVAATEGPLLILAGAGSGKTRVLTARIAHLVLDHGVPLSRILAMTFSNKAAREMHDRVKSLLQDDSTIRYPWISTFHSVCVRLLRQYGGRVGLETGFAIYDSSDQMALVKDAFELLKISDKTYHPKAVHAQISSWKNDGKFPAQVASSSRASHFVETASKIYLAYQAELLKAQAVDFDDLLLYGHQLLNEHLDVREYFQDLWKYVLVDEFQDTNRIQYMLLKQLIGPHQNIAVVGDDDQSIYGWRGAKIENILNFDREYPACRVVKLEQNYRSTANILKAAAAVIGKNEVRHEKTLWTDSDAGRKIRVVGLPDDRAEAKYIVTQIHKALGEGVAASEIAVLYRVNSVSRVFEEECLRQRLPYKIVGGFRFYERKEIKDIIAYLRLVMNPHDIIAFRRSINTPTRGVGKVSVDKLEALAAVQKKPLAEVLKEGTMQLSGKGRIGVTQYAEVYAEGRKLFLEGDSLVDLFVHFMDKSGYVADLKNDPSFEAREREENLQELLAAVQEFEEQWQAPEEVVGVEGIKIDTSGVQRKLFDFLERVALVADTDQLDQKSKEQVTFMTLHASKGLEFQTCFIAALEEGIFPSMRAMDSGDGVEEERRLCYVGITRAKEHLILTRADSRRTFGSINMQMPSRFLRDLPAQVLEMVEEAKPSYPNYASGGGGASSWGNGYYARKPKPGPIPAYEDESQDLYSEDVDSEFKRGDKVKHPSFGDGVVKKVEHLGSDECLTIEFRVKGKKKVLSQFVQAVE